ncbi:lipopolysaccharide assembly protein LapB [Roseibium sp. RKSG952]|uniref:tetratricopeptide repeat protein n=1 Tax=Roseibium sp. RKSG952 TaxID=2529384 RepID=UPI0012BC1F29|nr:tetratricopeptide repeat protein [Roseibium sp. RKSG952]MTH96814.1 tetratricopeptide repeat protein [Roseibium sp. RKSG952]
MTSDARKALERALEMDRSGKNEQALSAYLDALEQSPEDLDIAYRTATALLRAGFLDEAISQLRRIVFIDPQCHAARANLGNCHLLQNDLDAAATCFHEVLAASPGNKNALYGLASVHLQRGDHKNAVAPARKLVELLPDNAPALTLYAQSTANDPQVAASIAAFRKALQLDNTYVPALIGLAEVLTRRRRHDEALELAEQAVQIRPEDPAALIVRGEAFQACGRLQEARGDFLTVLDLDPANIGMKVRISAISRKLGDLGIALAFAHDAYEKDPGHKGAGNALGSALAALSRPKDAQSVLTSVARAAPLPANLKEQIKTLIENMSAEVEAELARHDADTPGTAQPA